MQNYREIVFCYSVSEILDRVIGQTAIIGNRVKDKDGKPMLEDIAMNEDDAYMCERFVRDAMTELKEKLVTWVTDTEESQDGVTIGINVSDSFSEVMVKILDEKIAMYLSYVVTKWWLLMKGVQEYQYYEMQNNIESIKAILTQTSSKNGKRKYRFF